MTAVDESDRPADRFDAARRTALQHVDGGTCWHCIGGTCSQRTWALEELTRHPGGRQVLDKLRTPKPVKTMTEEGQQR
ncbi:hypothetical protein B0E53_00406 [Micromonospora sp. MH33]|uniref:hypothetical protein n=1 Tax=Micromonospora sp. MH33 TaxID=1945509 RepID=UPI000D14AF52|nr:hypothetical protein [Micromonospora sp. MH33]PSK67596.1 hypothetical protein B0E53_00406 [Micromonospora sp. MH33]